MRSLFCYLSHACQNHSFLFTVGQLDEERAVPSSGSSISGLSDILNHDLTLGEPQESCDQIRQS